MRNTGEGKLEKMITRDDDSRVRAGPGAEERLPFSGSYSSSGVFSLAIEIKQEYLRVLKVSS